MSASFIKTLRTRYALVDSALYPLIAVKRYMTRGRLAEQQRIVDNLKEIIVGDPIVRLQEFSGEFALDVRSDVFRRVVLTKGYESSLTQLCLKHLDPNRDVIDVGANVGFYSVLLAKAIAPQRKVLAFEPTQRALKRLRENLALNHVTNVEIFNGVASNSEGTAEIKTIEGKEEYSSLGATCHPDIAGERFVTESVVSRTLDTLVPEKGINPGFIKVDVEGAEHLVFSGALKVLKEYRPVVLSELSNFLLAKNGSSSQEVIRMIESQGYDVFNARDSRAQPGNKGFGDIICFPKESKVNFFSDEYT
ncbi:FkbM family methyltransferase [Planctomicrobium sp. SH664]|uniref:FkbM family methyltransferase n=1 Tax=Planctomicrobium sp. SH664 TaxID=3448125 RepID=UPI003F5BBFBC